MNTKATTLGTFLGFDDGSSITVAKKVRAFPKSQFTPALVKKIKDSTSPVILHHNCQQGLGRAWGFLKGNSKTRNFSCNPFYGCGFNCSYCYVATAGILKHGGIGLDYWGRYIFVKDNLVDLMDSEMKSLKRRGLINDTCIRVSSNTDAYQPIERRFEMMRAILPKLAEYEPKWIFLQTKSDLILRDIDLLERIKKNLVISITITTDNDGIGRIFEMNAPLNSERMMVIQKLHDLGFNVEAMIAPILPLDSAKNLARKLDPIVSRIFIKSFSETKRFQRKMLESIIRVHGYGEILSERYAIKVVKEMKKVLGENRVARGQDDFLSFDGYEHV